MGGGVVEMFHSFCPRLYSGCERHEQWEWVIRKPSVNSFIAIKDWSLTQSRASSVYQGFWNFTRSRSREIQVYPRNPAKLTKTREIPRNSLEILPNTCQCNIFETYLGYGSCLLAVNLQIYLEISSLPRVNNVPKTTRRLRLMLRKPGHDKREDISLTLYGVWKETAVCSNAGTCLIVRAGHDRRKTQECFDFVNKWIWTFHHEQSCLVNCKATQESDGRKEIYCVAVFGSKLQLKKEAKCFGKDFYVFLVARNKYSCLQNCVEWTFVSLFLPWIWHPDIFSGIFRFCFLVCFSAKICPENSREIPAKSAVFSANLSLQILRNFTFFPANYQKPWFMVHIKFRYYTRDIFGHTEHI